MKCVSKYQTDDGKFFDSEIQAMNHEAKIDTLNKIKKEYFRILETNRADHLLDAFLENPVYIRDILKELTRKFNCHLFLAFQQI